MNKQNRTRVSALVLMVVLLSSCNLPMATSTEKPPLPISGSTSEPGTVGEPISVDEVGEVFDLAFDAQGNLWAGTTGGVVQCDADLESCRFHSIEVGSSIHEVRAVAVGQEGSLWFGTTAGLARYDAGAWKSYTSSDGLVADIIFDLQFDAEGGLWIGTSNGVSYFANGVFLNYTAADGLSDEYVHCVLAAGEGGMWFGTSKGVSHFDGVHWSMYDQNSVLPANDVLSISEDAQGSIWMGTLFGGAAWFDGSQWMNVTFPGDESNVVQAIVEAQDDALWFGTRAGAFRYDGNEWLAYTTEEGLEVNDVRAIAIGSDGALYFGTYAGITRFAYAREAMRGVQEPVFSSSTVTLPEGETVAHLSAGEPVVVHVIQMIDSERGWAIGGHADYGDHVLRTSDGSLTWQDVTPPEPVPEPGENDKMGTGFFLDESEGWLIYHPVQREYEISSYEIGVWHTTNGGNTWQWSSPISVGFLGSRINLPYIDFTGRENGWFLARMGGGGMHTYPVYLFATADAGVHWERLIDPYESIYLQSCQKTGMHFAGEQTGWVTIANCPIQGAKVIVTHDGGKTWDDIALPAPEDQPDLFDDASCRSDSPTLFSPMHGALTVSCLYWSNDVRKVDEYLYISQDGGETWVARNFPGGTLLFIDTDIAYALSTDIYRTQDGGKTWTKVKSVSWDGQFSFVSQELGWAVARSETEIALVRTEDGGQSWSIIVPVIASE